MRQAQRLKANDGARLIFGAKARHVLLDNQHAVVMPFVFTCQLDEVSGPSISNEVCSTDGMRREDIECDMQALEHHDRIRFAFAGLDAKDLAKEAALTMASKGFLHDDVEWRHVGALPEFDGKGQFKKFHGVFIDLTRVNKVHDRRAAYAQMITQLGLADDSSSAQLDAHDAR